MEGKMKRWFVLVLMILAMLLGSLVGGVQANASSPFLAEYPVPGKPHMVSVEAPNRVWFTLPEVNLIGRLVVTSTVEYKVDTYTVPTGASYPYDLKYAGGYVWFTERDGNKIGRLDPATGAITEYDIPTPDSEPTGIDVLIGDPTVVWFTESTANQLGQLVITDTTTSEMHEYPLPSAYPNAHPQDLTISDADSIWFTAPGVGRIGWFKPSFVGGIFNPYEMVFSGGEPWSISKESGDLEVWVTDRSGNRVGVYYPQTISIFLWYSVPTSNSNPYDVVVKQGNVWFTEEIGRRVGEVEMQSGTIYEYGVDATLHGLDVDANQHIWFAEYSANKIGEWKPPYFYKVMLPLISRAYP